MIFTYLPVLHEELPVRKRYEIGGRNYYFDIDYNDRYDFYSVAIYDMDNAILYSGKLTYLSNLINGAVDGLSLPSRIIPLNIEDIVREFPGIDRIGSDNFNSMRICVV